MWRAALEAFAALMNERARELGCTDTHFVTPNGLPDDDHYTTAADLCRIACTAMQNEAFAALVGTTYHETSSGDKTRTLKNKNKVLWQYEGGCGVKTGYTDAAGRCLVFAAEREGTRLVGVVLNCPDMWNAAYALLDYGFAAYQTRLIVDAGACVGYAAVDGGGEKWFGQFLQNRLYCIRCSATAATRSPSASTAPIRCKRPWRPGRPPARSRSWSTGARLPACRL